MGNLPSQPGRVFRPGKPNMSMGCWGYLHARCVSKNGPEVREWCACPCHDHPPERDEERPP